MPNVTNVPNFSATVHEIKRTHDEGPLGREVSAAAHEKNALKASARQELNRSVLEANRDVSINSGNQPLALLLRTAVEQLNEVLGPNAIQDAYDSGLDVSPEATAKRIVSMSTGFFASYQERNPEMSAEEAASSFVEIIRGAVEQGFAEAREVLSGLSALSEEIANDIDTTYDLVQVCRYLVKDFGTSQSPKSTRQRDSRYCPD
ncbi:MAG: DUF5610 domain-containing protein, partial [gamma proteobacterium symbiont of Phacoides pectinatus]